MGVKKKNVITFNASATDHISRRTEDIFAYTAVIFAPHRCPLHEVLTIATFQDRWSEDKFVDLYFNGLDSLMENWYRCMEVNTCYGTQLILNTLTTFACGALAASICVGIVVVYLYNILLA